jgi:hypothetical protein
MRTHVSARFSNGACAPLQSDDRASDHHGGACIVKIVLKTPSAGFSPDVAPALRRDLALDGITGVRRDPHAAIIAALPSFRKRSIGDVALRQLPLIVGAHLVRRNLFAPNVAPALWRNVAFDGFARVRRNPHAAIFAALRALGLVAIGDRSLRQFLDGQSERSEAEQRRSISQQSQGSAS